MYSFHNFLKDLYKNTKIPFSIKIDDGNEISMISTSKEHGKIIEIPIDIGYKKGYIKVLSKYESCINLLKYCIENELKKVYISKEEILIRLIEGQDIPNIDIIENNIPFLLNEFYLINIYIENNINEGLDLIKAGYKEHNSISFSYDNNIIMIGSFEDIEDHVNSIKDSIALTIYSKCYISYKKINELNLLKETFEINKENIKLAIKYCLSEGIYGERNLLFESIIDNISDKIKNNVYKDFNEGFSKLDGEMTKTIEVFFECGLNISDSSKKLYVHRNTLIYRLDKIYKLTSYDIRIFNEAVIFKIAFFIWKEKSNIIKTK